jgi:carboxymethylenebutenolidase
MHDEFSTPVTKEEKADSLIHLYVDGGLNRREVVTRLAKLLGGTGAAMAALQTAGLGQVIQQACPDNIKVAENDPAIQWENVSYPGDGFLMRGLLARPKNQTEPQPAVIVIHENRGLVEHIRDVTRRAAKAGFVALGIDLLSRQGGTEAFPDDTTRGAAYGRTLQPERYNDIYMSIEYLQRQSFVVWDRIGATGFCAGGGNIFHGVYNKMPLQAAVPYYGTPPANPLPADVTTAMLCIFSDTDRNQAARIGDVAASFANSRNTFGIHSFKGTGHGFHNDTGAIYNPVAACEAWARTIEFFNIHLRAPRAAA